MNYYKRHLGDYAKDTKHLTLAEHGAFTVLLDYYYATEKPIPDDRCERIANAYADYERAAVRAVLSEFFTQTPEGWINRRADRVIGESAAKSLKAKESADSRWSKSECERNANASKTHDERNASHKPLAISHKPLKKDQKTGADAPTDPKKAFWDAAVECVGEVNRARIGKLCKTYGEDAVAKAVAETLVKRPANPMGYIAQIVQKAEDNPWDGAL
ncbi:MAG: YdaU family protein [Pseudomonadota bacterium]|nr:YdaU family protein [Pseudomonadota bacterium]